MAGISPIEEIYPDALRHSMKGLSDKERESLANELQESLKFRELRKMYSSKAEWVRSRQYSKYRHTVPPRLEWLVDIGLLTRLNNLIT